LVSGSRRSRDPSLEHYDELAGVAQQASRGDRSALRTLVLTVGPHLLRVVRKVLGSDHPEIDDVVQDCAFAVVEAIPCWRGESTVLHFVCRIAALHAMKIRRRDSTSKRSRIRDHELSVETLAAAEPFADHLIEERIQAQGMRRLLDELPVEQAEVLMLHCVLGFTIQEMAKTSGTPLETLRSRMRLAKGALRRYVLDDPQLCEMVEEQP
jgi:RNA polymerase sigma-70 factor (ECF subfamily)